MQSRVDEKTYKTIKTSIMKTPLYILIFLFMGANFVACTPDTVTEESDRIESTTLGEDENDPEDEEDQGN